MRAAFRKRLRVAVPGLGTFTVAERKARTGVNPRTKASIRIPSSTTVRFKAGKDLADDVLTERTSEGEPSRCATASRADYPGTNNLLIGVLNVAAFFLELSQGPDLTAFLGRWGIVPDRLLHPGGVGDGAPPRASPRCSPRCSFTAASCTSPGTSLPLDLRRQRGGRAGARPLRRSST